MENTPQHRHWSFPEDPIEVPNPAYDPPKMGDAFRAIENHCLKRCNLGPTISSPNDGPDGPISVSVRPCSRDCAEHLKNAMGDVHHELHRAIKETGASDLHIHSYEEEEETSKS